LPTPDEKDKKSLSKEGQDSVARFAIEDTEVDENTDNLLPDASRKEGVNTQRDSAAARGIRASEKS